MRRKFAMTVLTMALSGIMSFSAWAGQWKSNSNGWWYDNGNGSYPISSWQWIDGDGDGMAECYYFNDKGFCLINGAAPDGSIAGVSGAWTVSGIVQSKQVNDVTAVENETVKAKLFDLDFIVQQCFNLGGKANKSIGGEWTGDNTALFRAGNGKATAFSEYALNQQYTKLTVKCAPGDSFTNNAKATLVFLNQDGKVLLKKTGITNTTAPFDVTVDLTGVQTLRIECTTNGWLTYITMKEAYLY